MGLVKLAKLVGRRKVRVALNIRIDITYTLRIYMHTCIMHTYIYIKKTAFIDFGNNEINSLY